MNRFLIAFLLSAVLLVGCSGGRSATDNYGAYVSESYPAPAADLIESMEQAQSHNQADYDVKLSLAKTAGAGMDTSAQEQKIILDAELRMATDRFDEVTTQIRNIAALYGGYVQNSHQYSLGDGKRQFMIILRVPYEQYEYVTAEIKQLCVLLSASESQSNATAEYYDIQARLQTKLIEEERLLELLDRTESIENILELESLLGHVRTQIEVYQVQMTSIDRLSSYSTINVYLDEVMDETTVMIPTNLSGKIYESFIKSVNLTIRFAQGILIFLVRISVPMLVVLVAVAIILGMFRVRRSIQRMREGL